MAVQSPVSNQTSLVEIALYGRGGQGVKMSGDIISYALFDEGKKLYSQPKYGSDRMGTPVGYSIKFDREGAQLNDRSWIKNPGYLVVMDTVIFSSQGLDLISSLKEGGILIINSKKDPLKFSFLGPFNIATVDASGVAKELGLIKGSVPLLSPIMPGAFSKVTGMVSMESLEKSLDKVLTKSGLTRRLDQNIEALRRGYEEVRQ